MAHLLAVFLTVFLAELGDKTRLTTLLFAASGRSHPLATFGAAGGALLLSTAIAVALGTAANQWLEQLPLKLFAGMGFVAVGAWLIAGHLRLVGS